jgi:hypothetical protein
MGRFTEVPLHLCTNRAASIGTGWQQLPTITYFQDQPYGKFTWIFILPANLLFSLYSLAEHINSQRRHFCVILEQAFVQSWNIKKN